MTIQRDTDRVDNGSTQSLAEAALPHLDEIRSRARDTEEAREPLPQTIDLVKSLGIVRALVPRVHGGLEHDVFDWLQSLRVLSRGDMSVGWFAGLASAHSFALTKFDTRVQDEIWGETGPDAIISSATALAEGGVAKRVNGGVTLSGRWRFSSGIPAADWAMVLIKAPNPASGDLEPYWALLPKSDFTIADTWHVAGMRGTGSHDIIISEAFVPAHRLGGPGLAVKPLDGPHHPNPLYTLPFLVMYPIIFAPIALGGAEAAVELSTQQLTKRKAALSGAALVESQLAQVRLAEAAMKTRATAALLEKRWREVANHALTGQEVGTELQMWWRVDDAYAGREAMRIVEHIIEGAGASIYYQANPLQRIWRDLHSTGGHTHFNTDSAFQILGRNLLGLAPDPSLV